MTAPQSFNRIFSGMQPTHHLHLGNYFGALRNWVCLQYDYECIYCIVDLHALTLQQDPKTLQHIIHEVTAAYIAAGIDIERCIVFRQSHVPAHCELSWILSCHTPLGWLNRMTQFKEKAKAKPEDTIVGLYVYPILMAADILLYKATHVPVGEDQKQHLELSRDIAGNFNRVYGKDYFILPEPQILGAATRVMSLRDGTKKMSKSDPSDYARINLSDDPKTITRKILKAKTDPYPLPETIEELNHRPEANNLITIYAALTNQSKQTIVTECAGQSFARFKTVLSDVAVAQLSPISTEMNRLLRDRTTIDRFLTQGAERARNIADVHLAEIKQIIGLLSPGDRIPRYRY